ncbi:hypothetical protein J4Q44_G00290350 [Coregonus suidteri]|uniref:Pyrin domain-containing protein n=1 Tax=Coregonus suidteri TaxID=861788 RepID=A0AAN8QT99_9TELE
MSVETEYISQIFKLCRHWLTRSGEKRHHLERQREEHRALVIKEPVAASKREQKPAGTHNANLPSTSSGMLTRSGEKCRRLERQREEPRALGIKRHFMLDVPALLLATLEELTGEQLKTFQSNLTSVQLPDFSPIPESQLENTDRQDTVDQMVKTYSPERVVEITLRILRKMNLHDLAKKLQRDHRDIPLEMANSLNTEVAVNTQENTQRMDEELGRERGLFQCSITGLVFRMEGEGEVLYRTVPWNRRLLAQRGKRPAGPLFKFTCLKGSVCQLHLPHCEIYPGDGCDFLSVAHVTDDIIEFLDPHEITETHIIINITGFCDYGPHQG